MCLWLSAMKPAIKTPTWIQSQKQHVQKHRSEEDSLETERASASRQQFSVEELEHGFKFAEYSSCRTQTNQTGSFPLQPLQIMHVEWETLC